MGERENEWKRKDGTKRWHSVCGRILG